MDLRVNDGSDEMGGAGSENPFQLPVITTL